MPKNAVYHYDHEACAFVAVEPDRKGLWLKAGAVASLALVFAALGVGVLLQTVASPTVASPTEVAQRSEIEALRTRLDEANTHLASFSGELADLAETDRELYRTVLHANPASEERFQMGTGGAADERFGRFSTPTKERSSRRARRSTASSGRSRSSANRTPSGARSRAAATRCCASSRRSCPSATAA